MTSAHRHRAALLAIPLAAAGVLGVTPAQAAEPGPTATALACRGAGVDPAAKIRYRTERFIKAPPSKVWRLQTEVTRWPT